MTLILALAWLYENLYPTDIKEFTIQFCFAGKECFKCKQEGHFSRECPNAESGMYI